MRRTEQRAAAGPRSGTIYPNDKKLSLGTPDRGPPSYRENKGLLKQSGFIQVSKPLTLCSSAACVCLGRALNFAWDIGA